MKNREYFTVDGTREEEEEIVDEMTTTLQGGITKDKAVALIPCAKQNSKEGHEFHQGRDERAEKEESV